MRKNLRKPRSNARLFPAWQAIGLCVAMLPAAFAVPAYAAPNGGDTSWSEPGNVDVDRIATRLKDSLSSELKDNFNLFLYVDKAETGPFAQRMYVFHKTAQDGLALLYDWPVSTGREDLERDAAGRLELTTTPRGYYELDPSRIDADHHSSQWNEPMPDAMFFSWTPDGHQTGLAIHAATGEDIAELGTRGSAGCIRLAPEHAEELFNLIRSQFRAATPKLAYRDSLGSVSSNGLLLHEQDGSLELADGYSVLVLVDDYTGDEKALSIF
jgi:hypothetical protein